MKLKNKINGIKKNVFFFLEQNNEIKQIKKQTNTHAQNRNVNVVITFVGCRATRECVCVGVCLQKL